MACQAEQCCYSGIGRCIEVEIIMCKSDPQKISRIFPRHMQYLQSFTLVSDVDKANISLALPFFTYMVQDIVVVAYNVTVTGYIYVKYYTVLS